MVVDWNHCQPDKGIMIWNCIYMWFVWCVFRVRQLWRCTVTTKSSVHSARCRKPCDCAGIHRTWLWNAAVWLSEWSSAPVGSVQQAHWKVIWCSWWQASALPENRGCIRETPDSGQRWLLQVLEKQRICLWARWYILYQAASFFPFFPFFSVSSENPWWCCFGCD